MIANMIWVKITLLELFSLRLNPMGDDFQWLIPQRDWIY